MHRMLVRALPFAESAAITRAMEAQEPDKLREYGKGASAAGLPSAQRQLLGPICTNVQTPRIAQAVHAPDSATSGTAPRHSHPQNLLKTPGVPSGAGAPPYVQVDMSCCKGRLPFFVHSLLLQKPLPGQFTVDDLEWSFVEDRGHKALAAAIPEDRVSDFQAGEAERGKTRVHRHGQGRRREGLILQQRATCMFERPRHPEQQKRQRLEASAPTVRFSKTQAGNSCKRGCVYCFYVKKYAKVPGVVVLKFPCEDGDTRSSCRAMQHVTREGVVAHTELHTHHLRKYTDEVTQLVIQKLRMEVKPATIISGALSCASHVYVYVNDAHIRTRHWVLCAHELSALHC